MIIRALILGLSQESTIIIGAYNYMQCLHMHRRTMNKTEHECDSIAHSYVCITRPHLPTHLFGCAGKSKGRSYPPMTSEEHQWLDTYYAPHNTRLRQLLTELGRTPPGWLVNSAFLQ